MYDFEDQLEQRRFLLSIDGGGGRGGRLSLLIIQEILRQIREKRPGTQAYNVFDLAGGTGAGGLVVIMLFRLQMDIDIALADYLKLTSEVKSAPTAGIVSTIEGSRSARLGLCFESIINKRKVAEKEHSLLVRLFKLFKAPIMVNQSLHSKAFTCALRQQRRRRAALGDSDDPDFFISWEKRENNWDMITIIDAAKATCAFSKAGSVTIKDNGNAKRTYNGNPLSDPHGEVLKEAQSVFTRNPTVMIAIGTGGFEARRVDGEGNIHFEFKCDVTDGWKQGDDPGVSHNTIGDYLPIEATVLIQEFVELYLGSTTSPTYTSPTLTVRYTGMPEL